MADTRLPFDTSLYDSLPISTFIYIPEKHGGRQDFRLVYGNRVFARDWKEIHNTDVFEDSFLRADDLLDEYCLARLERGLKEPPRDFSTYLPMVRLHLHFQPITNLQAPFGGFFVTNITDYERKDARIHFLRTIRQMKNNALLMRRGGDGRLEAVHASDEFAKMMECSPEEAVRMMDGMGFFRTTHTEDRPFERSLMRRKVTDDGGSDLTIQKITARKNRIWCRVHYAFIDDFGEHYIYCTYTNVSLLKQYEERLRSVYTSLGTSFYQENDKTLALFRVNLSRNVVEEAKGPDLFVTDSVRLPYSDLCFRHAEHYPIAEERERFLRTFDRGRLGAGYLEGRVQVSEVLYSQRKSGLYTFVKVTAALTRHPLTSDLVAFITERECNVEKVRDLLARKILARQFDMVAFLVNGSYGVGIGDASLIQRGSIFPLTRTGAYGEYLKNRVLPVLHGGGDYRETVATALSLDTIAAETRVHEPYIVNIEIEIDGEIFHKRFDFYLADPQAQFYVVLKSDTTEMHREQAARNEQLRAALAEARQANVAKTAFLSSMSHEIRTPMNAIIGLDSLALREKDLSVRVREYLEKIGGSARHLLGLINDILDMSRIESGRMSLKNEEFSLKSMLDQINTMIGGQCQDRGLAYEFRVDGPVSPYYIGDDMKLKQVLINILGNAVKFTPAPGTVSFLVHQTAEFNGQATLRFLVQDTGIGMDKDYLPRIFDAFTQEDATATNLYGGSGLGMAITKNIVEMMNGSIAVESEKGKGSTFTVTVSLRSSLRTNMEEQEFRPQGLKALIIDDDSVAREHAQAALEEIGLTADAAADGKEGLAAVRLHAARHEPYNLALIDQRMPGLSGVETARQIRGAAGEEPILIMAAYSWQDVEAEAREAGIDGFLTKPLFAADVLDEVKRCMDRRRQKEPEADSGKADLTGRRVLLAEDMAINAEIMIELLGMCDMEAEHAENGKIALDLFAGHPEGWYDAILMDMRMPVMDGLTAAKSIRALHRADAKKIPIIALTANAFDEDVQRSLQAGINAHLTKPVEPERLFDTLSELIEP